MQTQVKEILAHKGGTVYRVSPDDTVAEAIRLMNERKIGATVVMEGDQLVGMFTERDVLTRVVPARLDAEATRVRDVMSTNLVVIKPTLKVEEAMQVVTEKKRRHLPVMHENKVLGLISIGDLTRWLVREHEYEIETLLEYINGPQLHH